MHLILECDLYSNKYGKSLLSIRQTKKIDQKFVSVMSRSSLEPMEALQRLEGNYCQNDVHANTFFPIKYEVMTPASHIIKEVMTYFLLDLIKETIGLTWDPVVF